MRRIIVFGLAAALSAGLMLLPASAFARHKHTSCPRSAKADRNRDRIPDRWECRHNLSLKVKQTRRDPDRDGLNNLGEFQAGDDPHKADSDGDGVNDGNEHAGKIKSYVADAGSPNTGRLTIMLDGGGDVSGKVTSNSECKVKPTTPTATATRDGSESEGDHSDPGDNRGPGSTQEGDNHGDIENEHCAASDLAVGRTVSEAELKLENGQGVFDEIELV